MDVAEYKTICNQPNALKRFVIEASEQVLRLRNPVLALSLKNILKSTPISKPVLHNGSEDTDYFLVTLDVAKAEQIMEYLVDAEVNAVGKDGKTTRQASYFGSLVDAWLRYIDFCDEMAN